MYIFEDLVAAAKADSKASYSFFPVSQSIYPFGHSSYRTSRLLRWLPLKASLSAQSTDVEMNIIIQRSDDKCIEQNQVRTKTF